MKLWEVFVHEATVPNGEDENPVLRLRICRKCGATDNGHDPHIPPEYRHDVTDEDCSRCIKHNTP